MRVTCWLKACVCVCVIANGSDARHMLGVQQDCELKGSCAEARRALIPSSMSSHPNPCEKVTRYASQPYALLPLLDGSF